MEVHLSVAVDKDRAYRARGLSLQPTRVRRFLERVDLRYDPQRPAPLETRLSGGGRPAREEAEAGSVPDAAARRAVSRTSGNGPCCRCWGCSAASETRRCYSGNHDAGGRGRPGAGDRCSSACFGR